jgi:LCP family protein required for cell wall assembly
MHPPRGTSAFTAAFLSLLFPGLGHLYAGAHARALGFAAAPILAVALGAGVLLRLDRLELLALVFNPFVLTSVFVLNLVLLAYRLVAIVDAYRVVEYVNAQGSRGRDRAGGSGSGRNPLSIAGLLAVLLVMSGSHVVVARYDLLALDIVQGGCIFIGDTPASDDCDDDPSPSPGTSPEPTEEPAPTGSPTPEPTPVGTDVPTVSIPPWDGSERLNILLIGADEQGGGHNTDTLITVSVDPVTKQVAMFSLPRDTVDVPVPAGPAQRLFGRTYGGKINSFYSQVRNRADLFPGTNRTRGYNGLKAIIGELYGLDIRWFVEVNFDGFRKVIDAVGGVTVNVQVPVVDDRFPVGGGRLIRLYIPSGLQHMDGRTALRYARSRNTSSDFDRAARQQRVLLSLRDQMDPVDLLPRLPALINALKSAVRTDIPVDQIDELLGLASEIDTRDIRSYVFTPPLYQREYLSSPRGYIIVPYVDRIRAAVRDAFTVDPQLEATRERLSAEGATVWVLNGTNVIARGTRLSRYLEYWGIAASAPRQKPEGPVPPDTRIVVYNGGEADLAETIAFLEATFGVTATYEDDPSVAANITVTIGTATPDLEPPATT